MDIISTKQLTIEIRAITARIDFDDPEDGIWLSGESCTCSEATGFIDDIAEDTMRAHSLTGDSAVATLTSPDATGIGLEVSESIGLDIGGSIGLAIAPAPVIPEEIFGIYSWANLGSGGYNQLTWADMQSDGDNPLRWSDMTE